MPGTISVGAIPESMATKDAIKIAYNNAQFLTKERTDNLDNMAKVYTAVNNLILFDTIQVTHNLKELLNMNFKDNIDGWGSFDWIYRIKQLCSEGTHYGLPFGIR